VTSGNFITFEGGEGAGKSTQVKLLAERLREKNISVVETREPGGTERGEKIREFLLSGQAKDYGSIGEAVLFSAAREDHVRALIRPALARSDWVLCDRFSDSTAAYQGAAGGVKPALVRALERVAVDQTMPDLTFILDLPPEVGLKRVAERNRESAGQPDRFEGMDLAFHEALREAFLTIARERPERCVVIDAQQAQSAVAEHIWEIVLERFLQS
jgi:dTMP kinase